MVYTVIWFLGHPDTLSSPSSKNPKKFFPKNTPYIFGKNFLALVLKKMIYFLKEKLFLYFIKRKHFSYFQKWNPALFCQSFKNKRNAHQENFLCFRKQRPPKNFLFFSQKKAFLIFRGKETHENIFHLRKWNFQSTKNEKRKKKLFENVFHALGN